MMYVQYITFLLLATVAWADYYIDNANSSVSYAMAPSQTGPGWQTFSVSTQSLELSITNSTGNFTILLNSSSCYDQNYALGVCGVGDNCYVEIPFTGSGITMYVFNAGASGMTASFAIDGGPAVSSSINAPPGPNFQVSNVSLYNIQGLTSGNHTMMMTVLDWNGSPTSMKFDYAYVNESLVAAHTTSLTSSTTSTSTSQTPSQTSTENLSSSNKTNTGAIVGGSVAGAIVLVCVVISLLYFRKRKARQQDPSSSESTFHVNPFTSEYHSDPTPPLFSRPPDTNLSVPPLVRSAILRDALAAGVHSSPVQSTQSIRSGMSSLAVLHPIRHAPSTESDARMSSSGADGTSPFSDSLIAQHNLTEEQLEVIDRLRADDVPLETIARVIEGFVASRLEVGEAGRMGRSGESILSNLPPSYQTRER